LAVTWPANGLLPAVRGGLDGADDALLCVAFVNRQGISLLEPQLAALGGKCHLLVTSVFGTTTGTALAAVADMRVQVRILNLPGGTFHPKLYLVSRQDSGSGILA
jgi:HKD family nuclease